MVLFHISVCLIITKLNTGLRIDFLSYENRTGKNIKKKAFHNITQQHRVYLVD